jgi:DHA1 family multidrug resistance protein-like MFS transporter
MAGVLVLFGVREKFIPADKEPGTRFGFKSRWVKIIKSYGVPITFGMRFLGSLGRMMIIPIIPLFVEMILTDPERLNTITGLMLGVASGATTLSAVYMGRLGDRVGHRKVLIGCSIAATMLYLPQILVTEAWQLIVCQVMVGIAIGGIIPTVSALLAAYTTAGEEGAVYGLDNSINAAGRAIAPLLGAWVATMFGMRLTFAATAFIFLVSVVLAVWLLPKPRPVKMVTEPTD